MLFHSAESGQPIPGVDGSRDEKTGLVEVTISVWAPDLAAALSVGDILHPSVSYLKLISREFGNWDAKTDGAGLQVDLRYSGVDPALAGQESWSFDTSFREEPIEAHPRIDVLKSIYGGTVDADGKIVWPEKAPANTGGDNTRIGLSQTARANEKNPMFGLESYLVFGSIAKRRYVSDNIDDFFRGVGRIFGVLPGNAPAINFDDGRDWLKMAPSPAEVGDAQWGGEEEYMLSPEGGWPRMVHELISGT